MSENPALPPVPLTVSHDEEKLIGTYIKVCLNEDRRIYGVLLEFNNTKEFIVIIADGSDHRQKISFVDLNWISFPNTLHKPNVSQPIAGLNTDISLPEKLQRYKLVYLSDKVIKGTTRGWLVDDYGLHLFPADSKGHITRLFVPLQVLQEYRIGPLIMYVQRDDDVTVQSFQNLTIKTNQLEGTLHQKHVQTIDSIGQLLVRGKVITLAQLDKALKEQERQNDKKLGEILEQMDLITSEQFHRALALQLGFPFVRLQNIEVDPEVLTYISEEMARAYFVMPLSRYKGRLVVGVSDPTNVEVTNLLRFTIGEHIEIVVATEEDIQSAINHHYGAYEDKNLMAELKNISTELNNQDSTSHMEMERLAKEKPTVRLVNHLLADAINRRASDMHIRPTDNSIELMLRIDGNLLKVRQLDKVLLPVIISRIKILGRMDITERRIPQDGRTHLLHHGHLIDMRISVIPTVDGESAVIRILDKSEGLLSIAELGFSQRDQVLVTDLLHRTNGIILVTGPTGSGKSTTLYAALGEIVKQNVNIITVEDPVEYHIQGVEQIQVNTAPGYTFAKALRHILRHDPDVIMVGEIRDGETAKIAIESALTGHLVLSTLHTNSAAGTVSRLLEMGIEPYLLNSTLLAVLAQRLVRKNCPHCLTEEPIDKTVRQLLRIPMDEKFYRGQGCEHCNHTGYLGRMAVYELLLVTSAMRDAIHEGISVNTIQDQAIKDGMTPLTENALQLAREQKISLAEVYRVRLD